MPTFAAPDGTQLAYHEDGAGPTVVCLPGGPMLASEYLGDLGGLDRYATLIRLDLRGTGESATPADPATYRCDRLVDDVEALRERLGRDRMTLLTHSAGTNLAVLYAARHPQRVDRLVIVGPSVHAVGIVISPAARRELAQLRSGEPWFAPAWAALDRLTSGTERDGDEVAISPFFHGTWDAASRAFDALAHEQRNDEAAAIFGSAGAYDPPATRAALAGLHAPVLVVGGEFDLNSPPGAVAEFAGLFPNASLCAVPRAGHYPWRDDPATVADVIAQFVS